MAGSCAAWAIATAVKRLAIVEGRLRQLTAEAVLPYLLHLEEIPGIAWDSASLTVRFDTIEDLVWKLAALSTVLNDDAVLDGIAARYERPFERPPNADTEEV